MTKTYSIVRLLVATACVAALLRAPAVAGDAILKIIPKKTIAFVVVNDLEKADQAWTELTQAIQLPIPGPLTMLKQETGLGDSVVMKGDMAFIYYKEKTTSLQAAQPFIVALPISDHKKLLSQFEGEKVTDTIQKITLKGVEVLVAEKGGFTILSHRSAQELFESFLASKENIVDEMTPWKAWAEKNVVYGILTNYGVKESMKEGIEQLEGTLETFEQFEESSPQLDQIKKMLGLYVTLLKGIRDNANQIGAGLSKTSEGAVKLATRCDMTPGSDMAKMIDEIKALPADPLSVLPAGSFVFAGGGPIPQKAMAMLLEFAQGMSGTQLGLDAEENAKMVQLSIDSMKAILGQSFVIGSPASAEGAMMDSVCAAIWVKDADAYLASYAKQVEATMEVYKGKDSMPLPSMDVKETTIDGYKALVVTVDMSGMFATPEMAPAAELLKSIYGEDYKVVGYMAKASDTLIVSAIGSEENLKKAIKVAKSKSGSLADTSGVKEVTAMLPTDAQWFVYWSPAGTVDLVNWVIAKLPEEMKMGMPFEQLPAFPPCPPVGVAAKVGNGTVEKVFVFPPATIRSMTMYFLQLQMMGPH